MVPVVNQNPPCFRDAVTYFSVPLPALRLRNPSGQSLGRRILALRAQGRGAAPMHTHVHSRTTRGHKAQTGTDAQHPHRSAHLQTSTYRPPTSPPQHRRTRPRAPRPLVHSNHTPARYTRASTCSRTAHSPRIHPLARHHAPAHRHARARTRSRPVHTLLRAPMPLLTGTRARAHALAPGAPRAHTHTLTPPSGEGRGGAGAAASARPGAARRGRGAARGCAAGARAARRSEGAQPAREGLGWAGRP